MTVNLGSEGRASVTGPVAVQPPGASFPVSASVSTSVQWGDGGYLCPRDSVGTESVCRKHLKRSLGHGKCSTHIHILVTLFTDEDTEEQSHTPPKATLLGAIRIPVLCSYLPQPAPTVEVASDVERGRGLSPNGLGQ